MPLTNQEGQVQDFAAAEAARRNRLSIGKQRRAPDPLGVIEEAANRHIYHIFNVGPWPQNINTGSTGYFYVPGCPKDKDYVECSRPVRGIEQELIIKDEYQYDRLMSDGWKFAQSVIGLGRGQNPKNAMTHYGLFASKNAVPTKEEIDQAKLALHATCSEIVKEARDIYAIDRKQASVIIQRDRHFVAAKVLNLKKESWMVESTPTGAISCPFCGSANDGMAVKCGNCHEIIDAVRYKALKEQQEEILTAPKKGK